MSKLTDNKTWLFGQDWLSCPLEPWSKSKIKEEIGVSKFKYNKKSKEILQNECIVVKLRNPSDIVKLSNLEKLLRVAAWAKKCDNSKKRDFSLFSYMPYLDDNGLLRLGKRLQFAIS